MRYGVGGGSSGRFEVERNRNRWRRVEWTWRIVSLQIGSVRFVLGRDLWRALVVGATFMDQLTVAVHSPAQLGNDLNRA